MAEGRWPESAQYFGLAAQRNPSHAGVWHNLGVSLLALGKAQPALAALLPQLSLDALTDPRLREQHFGVVEGMRVDDIKARHAAAWAQWLRFDADGGMPGGETARQFHARVMAALRGLAHQHAGQTVMVVTHGGVLDMIWRNAQALSLHGPRVCDIPNAGVNHVAWRDAALHIQAWADTAHLADMPPQPIYRQTQHKA
jgi:probable phosphoglycerate mutase